MGVGRNQYRGGQRQKQSAGNNFRRRNQKKSEGKPSPPDARLKIRRNIIKKTNPSAGGSKVQLYTTHFDARNKIIAKKGGVASKQKTQGVAQRALNEVRSKTKGKGAKPNNPTTRVNPNLNANQTKKQFTPKKNLKRTATNKIKDNRETVFTGKSIKISTTNDLAPKERKTLVKGKSLSVAVTSGKNKPKANKQQLRKTIDNDSTTWIGPNLNRVPVHSYSPEPELEPLPSTSRSSSMAAKLVISNLHPNVTQEDIKELFGAIGTLKEGRLKSVGTAEVVYRIAEDSFAAFSKYHGRNLDGQPMILKITTADEPIRPPASASVSGSSRSSKRALMGDLYSAPPPRRNDTSYYSAPPVAASSATAPVIFTVKL